MTVPKGSLSHRRFDAATLRRVLERFPRGVELSRDDLAVVGWLYLHEVSEGSMGVSEGELRWMLSQAATALDLPSACPQPVQVPSLVQRLMRFGLLRVTFTSSRRPGYRLSLLGRTMARTLLEESDYGSEQLDALLGAACHEIERIVSGGGSPSASSGAEKKGSPSRDEELLSTLEHVFLGTIREKVEHKILSLEEDLEERKQAVRQTYSGRNEEAFEGAIRGIEYSRRALTELVDAVQELSASVRLEELLHGVLEGPHDPRLDDSLEESLTFLYTLRSKIDAMLKDVVLFIHDCVAFRTLAFTVDSRDRLCRVQERLLMHALEHDVRLPVPAFPPLPRMDFPWSPEERRQPVLIDMNRLQSLDHFAPPELPHIEPPWKKNLLRAARDTWPRRAREGGTDLASWLRGMAERVPAMTENPPLALWYLIQDWSHWTPSVSLQAGEGDWVPLGDRWLLENVKLEAESEQ